MNINWKWQAGILAVLILIVFWAPFFSDETLIAPDGTPFFLKDYQSLRLTAVMDGFWGTAMLGHPRCGVPLSVRSVLSILLPPMVYHVASYVVNVILVYFAAWYFLRGRGFGGITAVLPALAMAFSGYFFTVISAGHRGIFDMMPWVLFLLTFIDRGITRMSAIHFACAGMSAGYGLIAQPDVMVLFSILALAYGTYRLIQCWPKKDRLRFVGLMGIGAMVAMLFFGLVAAGQIKNLVQRIIPRREKQIELTKGKAWDKATPTDKWEFATDWSMPPEDMLEFVAPFIFGQETGSPTAPYWGRLGRGMYWDLEKKGLSGLRQHTVYMGVIQVLFALYAIVAMLKKRAIQQPDVVFWSVVAVVCTVLAMGRYTCAYRFFYMLPYVSKIRCPIKFLHITEVAVFFLFAAGLSTFLCSVTKPVGFFIGSLTVALLMILVIPFVISCKPSLTTYWASMGLSEYTNLMLMTTQKALIHSAVLFTVGAVIFGAAIYTPDNYRRRKIISLTLLAVVCVDLVMIAKPFIHVLDIRLYYAPNPVADLVKKGSLGRTTYFISPRDRFNPLWTNFRLHDVQLLDPADGLILDQDYLDYYAATQKSPFRLWQLTNTRYVVGPSQKLDELKQHPAFDPVSYFTVDRGRYVLTPGKHGPFLLIHNRTALPRASIHFSWQGMSKEDTLKKLGDETWDPRDVVLVPENMEPRKSKQPALVVNLSQYKRSKIKATVKAPCAGIVVVNDKYDKDWKVYVDGVEEKLVRCNWIMRGVMVQPGRHDIVFTYHPFRMYFFLSIAAPILLLLWAIGLIWKRELCTK